MIPRDSSLTDNLYWLGEQAQSQFLDMNSEQHAKKQKEKDRRSRERKNLLAGSSSGMDTSQRTGSVDSFVSSSSSSSSLAQPVLNSYNSLDYVDSRYTIRHQVIIWSVGIPDVKSCRVNLMFRVTLFWNDPLPPKAKNNKMTTKQLLRVRSSQSTLETALSEAEFNASNAANRSNDETDDGDDDDEIWVMDGRTKAVRKKLKKSKDEEDEDEETIDVPPISIINAADFEIIGRPDVTRLSVKKRLMRFSCMYRASLLQERSNLNVSQFPHDSHELVLKLGVLNQRQPNGRWDRRKWKLALANEADTHGTIKIPHGVLVDHVNVPGYTVSERGLEFELAPIEYGSSGHHQNNNGNVDDNRYNDIIHSNDQEFCVKAKICVKRNSCYYDKNIMPLLDTLNLVSISILVCLDAESFFQRGLLCLNIAFLEIGLRNSLDARLPHVGYEIKMQKILSSYFYSILYIVLESAVMKILIDNYGDTWTVERTRKIDHVQAFLLLLNQLYLRFIIYNDFSAV